MQFHDLALRGAFILALVPLIPSGSRAEEAPVDPGRREALSRFLKAYPERFPLIRNAFQGKTSAFEDGGRDLERRAKRFVLAERFKIGIAARQRAILGVEGDGALQMSDRFGVVAALRVRDRKRIKRVVVVRIFVAHEVKMLNGLVVSAAVDGQRGGVQAFLDAPWRGLPGLRVALADVQVKTNSLLQLSFVRVQPEDRFEFTGGLIVVVALERLQGPLVKGNRLDVVGRTPRRRRCR